MEDIKIRLIDVKTLGLQELLFDPTRVPKYAILSHTWGDSEVSFRQWNQWVQDRTSTSQHEGFEKVRLACIEARKLRYKYLWADTCCIRDDNEKEKHSCIDSMFEFYESSAVCLAYLSDLEHHDDTHSMGKCRWYRRGWTLQELIAPRNLRFYDRGWRYRGTKYELCRLVSRITRIDADVLTHKRRLGTVPTEEKKSWLRGRRTTHRRDKYYCLLGLFGMKRDRQAGNSPSPFTDNAQLQQDGPKYFETGYQSLVQQHDDGYGFTFQDFYSPKDLGELSIGRAGDWQYFHPIPGTGSTSSGANDIIYSLSISTDQGLVPPSVVPLHEPESMGGLELSHEGCINPASNVLVPVGDDPCDHREYKASPGSNLSHDTLVQVRLTRGRQDSPDLEAVTVNNTTDSDYSLPLRLLPHTRCLPLACLPEIDRPVTARRVGKSTNSL